MAKSYFINNIDSYIGQQFLTQLKGTEEEPSDNTIIGTKIDAKDWEKPQGMKKILKVVLFFLEIGLTYINNRGISHYCSGNIYQRWMC